MGPHHGPLLVISACAETIANELYLEPAKMQSAANFKEISW